ncbi:cold-regulated 413 plasma membrane protein 1-like isoform X2 [Magnolia sinica]|uniref:cold-regulated 413 plasma membrane protein 1-like isoform X2 n=1 Tax=Magnolia sinica TaxID=86752 RepID=UPI0026599ACA|nr:cold-regulated 413 plasma membrane protein 1-like isoform X2 [Magnolia sinica]
MVMQSGKIITCLRFLLILNHTGRRSHMQTSLLVAYIFSSLPTVLFNILRGQFGLWVAFLAVASHLYFPETFPVSRVVLFVVTPSWVSHALRDSIAGCISCLVIGAFLLLAQIRGIGGCINCCEDFQRVSYVVIISLLLLFPILYLWMGPY